jgi:hypothetical protein
VCNEVIDCLAERELFFRSAELRINRNIQAGLSGYYATESRQEPWNKIFDNGNVISDFPRGDAVAIC